MRSLAGIGQAADAGAGEEFPQVPTMKLTVVVALPPTLRVATVRAPGTW
jgi:hypothetical protein